jgi:hypothetical protein
MRKAMTILSWVAGVAGLWMTFAFFVRAESALAAQGRIYPAPVAADLVPNGTHFLVRLDDRLNSGKNRVNKKFGARTLESLQTTSGSILPAGARIHGHISRIEPGGLTGRARLWLTFDDINTRDGRMPLVAEVSSVPGNYAVRSGESKEGEIEARTSKGTRDIEAAAAGAAIGAAAGAVAHGGKGAAIGAAAGGAAGFVASSGIGQELDLPKGTKLDLVLDRPLYLTQ